MEISKNEIEHVAKLARIKFTEQEKEKFAKDFAAMIEFVNKLNELDTSNVQPTAHVLPIQNVFREDKIEPSFDREKILQNAPSQQDGYFKVPRIVE